MADLINPIIPKAGRLWIHSGNIVNWNRLKRKLSQSATEELSECMSSTIKSWLEEADRTELQYATDIDCFLKNFSEKLPEAERDDFKVTVKIFLNRPCTTATKEALEKAREELGVSTLDSVLISLPSEYHDLDHLRPVWETLEEQVREDRLYGIGTADLDKPKLEALYNWATVKPCIDQVNLESCCVMPVDLKEFAQENDIQLLTHNDPAEILTEKKFQEVLASSLTPRDSENWQSTWVVRYSVLIKCRGIIKAKGYIVSGSRDIKKQK